MRTHEIYSQSSDGLRLYARLHGDLSSVMTPVVCLPGLTRNADDFDDLAQHLVANNPARPVLAFDYRGRGRSAHARDPAHYSIAVETTDLRQVMAAMKIHEAIFIGTSRGGLITMALALTAPSLIKAAILNDIGPVLETEGLKRIASYVGRGMMPKTMAEAVTRVKMINADFTDLDEKEWAHLTNMSFRENDQGQLSLTYDAALSRGFLNLDFTKPQPELWPLFDALRPVPVMVIRGENSDLLSETTVKTMVARHPLCVSFTALNEAHAPLLGRPKTAAAIMRFVKTLR